MIVEFSHDSAKKMQAYLCIRCSKIWKFGEFFVFSPAVTTNHVMRWRSIVDEMEGPKYRIM